MNYDLKKARIFALSALPLLLFSLFSFPVFAQTPTQTLNSENDPVDVSKPGFKLVVCDGPDLSVLPTGTIVNVNGRPTPITHGAKIDGYTPCNFNGLMLTIQHLLNIAMVAGVFAAIGGFCYAGFLLIKGTAGADSKAKDIFQKVGVGFIIMLSAWFIVYQVLSWLTDNSAFKSLLGNP